MLFRKTHKSDKDSVKLRSPEQESALFQYILDMLPDTPISIQVKLFRHEGAVFSIPSSLLSHFDYQSILNAVNAAGLNEGERDHG